MFVKLLQGAFRLSHCTWLSGTQEFHVQECIKTLSNIGKYSLQPLVTWFWLQGFVSDVLCNCNGVLEAVKCGVSFCLESLDK